RHTRFSRDWSSDVCSSDLLAVDPASIAIADNLIQRGLDSIRMMRLAGSWRKAGFRVTFAELAAEPTVDAWHRLLAAAPPSPPARSEERRVGKEWGTPPATG